ncbi:hypothetical protein [Thiolapillus sp.]|uniref:hypothetical protein n=1 Tax=Thiolapillus sp. TaxID=2017437 RepID=UPI003AF6D42C
MPTPVELCNRALILLSEKAITSLSDGTLAAKVCNRVYKPAVLYVLQSGDWPFATETAILSAAPHTSLAGWKYVYTYPANALRILEIFSKREAPWPPEHQRGDTAFEVGSTAAGDSLVFTNTEDARVRYISTTVADKPDEFDPLFSQAVVYWIASQIAAAIVALDPGYKLSSQFRKYAMETIKEARVSAYVQSKGLQDTESSFIKARR